MKVELSASMMCANYANLQNEVDMLENGGIHSFHIDIMDGCFVDNFGMGYQDTQFIRNATDKPIEMHLMINNPMQYLQILMENKPDVIYIHPEADRDAASTLDKIRKANIVPGIAINPGTSISYIEELLNVVDRVLVLAVNPGHVGRPFAEYVGGKVESLLKMRDKYHFDVYWDGSATYERIYRYASMGVKGFVLGTATLFGKEESYENILKRIHSELEKIGNRKMNVSLTRKLIG